MNPTRPTVSAELLATLIRATPERVRRRLDGTPNAAAGWHWQAGAEAWSVDAGGETVTLPHGHVAAIEQLTCTCLLSPRCFHVLACLTYLEVALVTAETGEPEPTEPASADAGEDLIACDEEQRTAARDLEASLAQFLRVGVANAGVVVQSSLLRGVHQCRAAGLHRLAALGLRLIAGTREFRARARTADPEQLAEDLADALETVRHLLGGRPVAGIWVGTARRPQWPVRPRKLHGLFAEPILTRSGFAGAAVYFLGEDGRIYTASDVRPGDAQQARDAYRGGIEIGPLIQPARELARGLYLGTDLTASPDGRLGRGKGVKIVEQGASTWQATAIQERFRRPLGDQWDAVYAQAAVPAEARPAGWDFVFLGGTVLGAVGPELLFQPAGEALPIRLAIENDDETLYFRANLHMLSHAPGLRLEVIARVDLRKPGTASPLAAAPVEGDAPDDRTARLEIPAALVGRICLGFDEIKRPFLVGAGSAPVVLNLSEMPPRADDPLHCLRRRWMATLLSGLVSGRLGNPNLLRAETATLDRLGFPTGAALLDALCRARADGGPSGTDTFLAAAVYLRSGSTELARVAQTLGS